ncbi:MAG: acetyl-CoA carboxylase biotin carboxyl carrier protein [Cystobacterineae bacterium]|nr:acetyl-CoA carboxylase biotin carboxyl carrier protein [Cystobacterineae bacterium]
MQPKTKKGVGTKPAAKAVSVKAAPGKAVSDKAVLDRATPDRATPEKGRALDVHAVKVLIEAVERSKLSRLVWQRADEKLCIVREPQEAVAAALAPAPSALLAAADIPHAGASAAPAEAAEPQGHVIASPFVGTFYRAPGPEQPPFIELGSHVRKGQALCIVEAMKLMNEIEADVSGKVVAILVDNAQPVEFGQALFRLEPSP